jgi:hypothetical protein
MIVEIECIMCHKTKGLECFAKSQRANSDTAVSSYYYLSLTYTDNGPEMLQVYGGSSHP